MPPRCATTGWCIMPSVSPAHTGQLLNPSCAIRSLMSATAAGVHFTARDSKRREQPAEPVARGAGTAGCPVERPRFWLRERSDGTEGPHAGAFGHLLEGVVDV